MRDVSVPSLLLRPPSLSDEREVMAAQRELAGEGFDFMLAEDDQTWIEYLNYLDRCSRGVGLAPGRAPATMLLAVVDGEVVGRVHVRHALTPGLRVTGGHIGYGVRPQFRRRGYAAEMLRQGLELLGTLGIEQALVTCDDDNEASIRTIESNGGVLEDKMELSEGVVTRHYWIDTRVEA
ncbi:MAG: GNAT family N-acetyltransferase [Scrofimicrobium sp.]